MKGYLQETYSESGQIWWCLHQGVFTSMSNVCKITSWTMGRELPLGLRIHGQYLLWGVGVLGTLGGEGMGVFSWIDDVIESRKPSSCFIDRALCKVSKGLIGGTPPHPSIAENKYMANFTNKLLKLNYFLKNMKNWNWNIWALPCCVWWVLILNLMQESLYTWYGGCTGNHITKVGRWARPWDDRRREERAGGATARLLLVHDETTARWEAEAQHLEVAHLAGDAVPVSSD